jgi:hypothetical protein
MHSDWLDVAVSCPRDYVFCKRHPPELRLIAQTACNRQAPTLASQSPTNGVCRRQVRLDWKGSLERSIFLLWRSGSAILYVVGLCCLGRYDLLGTKKLFSLFTNHADGHKGCSLWFVEGIERENRLVHSLWSFQSSIDMMLGQGGFP